MQYRLLSLSIVLLSSFALDVGWAEYAITSADVGSITWDNADTSLYYTVEWSVGSLASNQWDGSYLRLQDIRSPEPQVTVPVPVFFRVSASQAPTHTGASAFPSPIPKTGQTISFRVGDDGYHQAGVAAPSPRFEDHQDGTVTDLLTGLMWTKDANLAGSNSWDSAVDFCNELILGEHEDWRLANVNEMISLIDISKQNYPTLPSGHPFENVETYPAYWTSSSSSGLLGRGIYYAYMGTGSVIDGDSDSTYASYCWPVRGGVP